MSGSRSISELRDRYAAADAELAAARATLGTNNPMRRTVEASTRQMGAALQSEINALLQSEMGQAKIARDSVARLTEALDVLKKRVLEAETARTRLASLEGEVAAERNVYFSQLQQLRSLDNVAALSKSEATLLSPAPVPPVASAPRLGIFAGFGACLFAGVAAAGVVWRQGARDVVRHTDDTIDTGTRSLAVMPEFGRDRRTGQIDRRGATYSFFLQELRAVCANLFRDFATPGKEGVSVLVTSPLPGDGKSTFCNELGRCAAMNGVRTLIISTDRKPTGRRGAADEVYEVEPGLQLYAVSLGTNDGVFHRRDARSVIERYQRDYGLVIIDTPPLSAMAESVLLAPVADATIVLARVEETPRSLLARVVQEIERVGGRLAGVVTTFAQLDSRRGLRPGDRGYYFAQNSSYHARLASTRLVEHAPAPDDRRRVP
jgi:polysaccharide biosynthesis transport protein